MVATLQGFGEAATAQNVKLLCTGTGRSPLPHGDPPAEGYAVPRHVQTRQDLIAADRIDTLCSSTEGARSYGQGVGGICDDRAEEPRPSRRYWRRRQLLDSSDTRQIELGTPVCTNTHSADILSGEECDSVQFTHLLARVPRRCMHYKARKMG